MNKKSLYDSWGIVLSIFCAVHCLALPILALASPISAHFLEDVNIHLILFLILMPISFIAFIKHRKSHEKLSPLVLASFGMSFLLMGILYPGGHNHDKLYSFAELLSVVGSILLIIAHGLNLKHLENCGKCSHH